MDFLKKGQEMLNPNSGSSSAQQNPQHPNTQAGQQAGNPQQGNAGSEDYGDKALDFIEKKTGHTMSRDTNEKITDGARGFYEKQTGNKVDPKWSN